MLIPSYTELAPAAGEKLTKLNQFESPHMFVDYYFLEPGQEQKPHTHAGSDKLYVVLEGSGMFLLGDVEYELSAGKGCVAPEGVTHGVRNHTAGQLVLLVSMAPRPEKGKG